MKVAIHVFFNSNKIKGENTPHFIDWNYPVLPRTGEYICVPSRFFSTKMKEDMMKKRVIDLFPDPGDQKILGVDTDKEMTLHDLYSDLNGDRWIVESVEWIFEEENGDYPLITITEHLS